MLNFDSDVDVDINTDVKCKKALHVQYQFRSSISFCMCLWSKRQASCFHSSLVRDEFAGGIGFIGYRDGVNICVIFCSSFVVRSFS